ncbi:ketopantoate reductase family protein [Devosia sp. PTR5]|uniref:2-dehydropantoate 2-reductase n=1 Tax=Devosia oryzisoli TaxID=2774138 RepID=A0A927ITC0_9HYPH|nr:ketopantoate reductase family protein [Devosia oryzisoli]
MRIVIYGVGAIGGTLAVKLARADTEVIGIARGAQFNAIAEKGLNLRTPAGDEHARFPVVRDPTEIAFAPTDLIFLTMKTQDTLAALCRLREAGVADQAIFCLQNGVANEEFALRLFSNVFGVMVVMPTTFIKPGEVVDFFSPKAGLLDVGRYGHGDDKAALAFKSVLDAAGFAAFVHNDIMPFKYAKLLMNLNNAVDAAFGEEAGLEPYLIALRQEAEAVYASAGIVVADLDWDGRKRIAQSLEVPGADRVGSSSAQSLARGASSIETDYLNGEIVRLGRLHGVPTPVNSYFMALAHRLVSTGARAGSGDLATLRRELPL